MKRSIIIIFCILGIFSLSFGIYLKYQEEINIAENPPTETENTGSMAETGTTIEEDFPQTPHDIVQKKIEALKKRNAWKWLLLEGDMFYENGQVALALRKYIAFYKLNPNDPLVLEKLWDTYQEMKKYSSALSYYEKITGGSTKLREKILLTQWYNTSLSDPTQIAQLREKILAAKLPEIETWYYTNSLFCVENFHECKVNFENYFLGQVQSNTNASGSSIAYLPLKEMQQSLENYKNFQVEDIVLKDAFIIGTWYSQELYPLSEFLGSKVLEQRKDYKPLIKIVAQSSYELGNYENAKNMLLAYNEYEKDDPSVSYMLGVIYTKLKEYVLSNVAFQRALELWYSPSIDVRRQIIYNYALLENNENMLRYFEEMISKESSIGLQDLSLAIYYHILAWKYSLALEWIQRGYTLFPESGNFYAYEWWILREQKKFSDSKTILETGRKKEPENIFLLMNLWYTFLEEKNPESAKIYFQKVVSLSPESDFWVQAQQELRSIENSPWFFN